MSEGIAARVVPAGPQPVFTVDFSIDGHSHIQSGATAPLPLIWNQAGNIHIKRSLLDTAAAWVDTIAPFILKGGRIQKKKTEEIADILVSDVTTAYKNAGLREDEPYRTVLKNKKNPPDAPASIFSPTIILPMDMDYAHIAGFPPESATIYHEGTFKKVDTVRQYSAPEVTCEGVYYYDRQEATAPENKGTLIDVSHERPNQVWVHQRFKEQMDATVVAVKKNPWQLIPMFHYDPRRWCRPNNKEFDEKEWIFGPWDEPFNYIATLKKTGIFIGFKMYPPLGYKPLDPRLPHLEKFYAKCAEEGIPILSHCSPGGMTTHEAKFYHALDKADLKKPPSRIVSCTYDPCTPLGYFFDNYVHPQNWRPVLMRYPKLKLCLAHFGGAEWKEVGMASDWIEEITNLCDPQIVQGRDSTGKEIRFENVYTDMSCFNLEDEYEQRHVTELFRAMKFEKLYRHLREKVIFGVDWYLSLITKAPEYKEYVDLFFNTMGEFDKWQWYRSALVNPATFYGLDNKDIVNNMHAALIYETKASKEEIKKKLQDSYMRISSIWKQVETIRKELEKTKPKAKE